MTKAVISNPAFLENNEPSIGFNLAPIVNNFTSIFDTKPLDIEEKNCIEHLLLNNVGEDLEQGQVATDVFKVQTMTAEIKAIQKQSIILIGERIAHVRTILRFYRDGTFTLWMKETFKSKQTGYNILSYYEFYLSLPTDDLRDNFKRLPHKIAYAISSRDGGMDIKLEILKNSIDIGNRDLLPYIREKLPLPKDDKRRAKNPQLSFLDSMKKECQKLFNQKEISEEIKEKLQEVRSLIDKILEEIV